jgi:hypothetical protein
LRPHQARFLSDLADRAALIAAPLSAPALLDMQRDVVLEHFAKIAHIDRSAAPGPEAQEAAANFRLSGVRSWPMAVPGTQRQFAAVQQDACNGRRSGRSADAAAPPRLAQSRLIDW